jgi:hypothetical protein
VSADVVAALNNPVPSDGVGVSAFAAPFKGLGPNASILVGVELDHLSMTRPGADGRLVNDVELSVAATDLRSLRDGRSDRLHVALPANAEATPDGHVRVLHRIALPPGQYQLRIAARDGTTGRVGSVVRDLDVPDFSAPLAMSGIALASNRSKEQPTTGDAEPLSALLEAPPAARRDFSPDDVIDAFAEVYESAPASATVLTSIRGARGDIVFTATENVPADTFRSDRRAYAHRIRIRVEDLDGQYVLRIEARSEAGASVAREVPFTVTP